MKSLKTRINLVTRLILVNTKIQLLVVAVFTIFVYANTLSNQFVWDDKTFAAWPLTKDIRFLPDLLKGALPFPHEGDFRPLKGVILLLDYQLFGLSPIWYHIQAIIIHLSATVLVYFVTKKIMENTRMILDRGSSSFSSLIPFLTALLFGLHPIHTEAVTFVTASTDIIGVSFFLGAFYLYLLAYEQYRDRKRRLALSLVLTFLAFVSYEITLVLPVLVIAFDLIVAKIPKKELGARLKTYALYFAVIIFYFLLRFPLLGLKQQNTLPENNLALIAITMIKAFFEYLKLTVFPLNLSVNHLIPQNIPSLFYIDYEKGVFLTQKISDFESLLSLAFLSIIAIVAVFLYKKIPLVTFCIVWFFVALAPVSNIPPLNNFMSERYLYLASFGYCFLLALIFASALRLAQKSNLSGVIIVGMFCILTALLAAQTFLRNQQWKNSYTLWAKELAVNPTSVLANHNLGNAYFADGKTDLALAHLETAYFNNQTNNRDVIFHLGYYYQKTGKIQAAIEKYKMVLQNNPQDFVVITQLADAYQESNLTQLAFENYQKAIEIEPRFYDAHIGLGLLYASQGQDEQATGEFAKAAEARPDLAAGWQNLGAIYIKLQKYDLAQSALQKAAKIDPENQQVQEMLLSATRLYNIQKAKESQQ